MSPLGCWLALLLRAAAIAAKDIFSFGGPLHPAVTVISLVTTLRPKPIEMAVDLCVRHLPIPPSLGAVHTVNWSFRKIIVNISFQLLANSSQLNGRGKIFFVYFLDRTKHLKKKKFTYDIIFLTEKVRPLCDKWVRMETHSERRERHIPSKNVQNVLPLPLRCTQA